MPFGGWARFMLLESARQGSLCVLHGMFCVVGRALECAWSYAGLAEWARVPAVGRIHVGSKITRTFCAPLPLKFSRELLAIHCEPPDEAQVPTVSLLPTVHFLYPQLTSLVSFI